ncbi:hypothetical protein D9M68_846450 [compost metagenome]
MPVHQHQAAHAVTCQLTNDVLHAMGQGGPVQAGGTGEVVAATGLLLRLVTVMQGWQHQRIDALSHPLANSRGQ